MRAPGEPLLWNDYFLKAGAGFREFWRAYLERDRDLLFMMGLGFDQRMCCCAEEVLACGGKGRRDAIVVEYTEGPDSSSHDYKDLRKANESKVERLFGARGQIEKRPLALFSSEGHRIGDRNIARMFRSLSELSKYTDVVVDISAFPKGLYFPLLARLLTMCAKRPAGSAAPNLHVVVSHSPVMDEGIIDEGIEETASFLHGFAAAVFEREATRDQPRIWIPILGKNQAVQLERAFELVQPDEICPVLPSPSRDPRQADDLILEYREFLFDRLRTEPQNIIYASESNPFEAYRQIMRSILHYEETLKPLGGCKVVLSSFCSKLLSLSAMMAALELSQLREGDRRVDVGVAHIEALGYRLRNEVTSCVEVEFHEIWLAGECYEAKGAKT